MHVARWDRYTPSNAQEAEGIIERVTPRLQHANSAVVMSAIKIVLSYMELITNQVRRAPASASANL